MLRYIYNCAVGELHTGILCSIEIRYIKRGKNGSFETPSTEMDVGADYVNQASSLHIRKAEGVLISIKDEGTRC